MPPPRLSASYGGARAALSRAALIEVFTALGRYRTALVLVGGWAPFFLLERYRNPRNPFRHVGSIDIDVAVDPAAVSPQDYATIGELIARRGYEPKQGKHGQRVPASFVKAFAAESGSEAIQLDFLTAPLPSRRAHRHRAVGGEILARMSPGCEVALGHHFEMSIGGALPGGGQKTVKVRVADLVGILATKGAALGDRYKEKDAYDIYSVLAHFEEGPRSAAAVVAPHRRTPAVAHALDVIAETFDSPRAHGPTWVADSLSEGGAGERERIRDAAFAAVDEFILNVRRDPEADG